MDRAARRRLLKEDYRRILRGIDIAARDAEQVVSLMRVLRDLLGEARREGSVSPLMTFLYQNIALADQAGPRDLIACRRGCSHCCHVWVSATGPEVLFAAAAIPARSRAETAKTIEITNAQTMHFDFEERDNHAIACPLLANNLCTVYAARPVTCRTAASGDAQICERSYLHLSGEPIPMPAFFMGVRSGYSLALSGALIHMGLPPYSYELNAALRAAISRPDAQRAWLEGEDIFENVRQEPGDNPSRDPMLRQLYSAAFG